MRTMDGIIVVDKPEGWTSHDAVNNVRRLANTRRVGHLGTLDPMATGVLPVVIDRATRLAQFYLRNDKIYDAWVRFGYSTDTYDREGTATSVLTDPVIKREALEDRLEAFRGEFLLAPPAVSAKKVGGVPAYRFARQNVAVALKAVPVHVYALKVLDVEGPEAHLWVHCSSGTYLRSIAHELGQAMGSGAHLSRLRRLRSGEFSIEQAHTLTELESMAAAEGNLADALIPVTGLLAEFPTVVIDDVTAGLIRQGRDFAVSPFRAQAGTRYVKAVSSGGELLAIGEAKLPHLYHPVVVL
ncbi:MAG: tRNA pseudouridine(55) synthase TruB [Acidobacteria bacterium]|nr:MAG: tRNA pseudouridine(55) synthase TruB [Acidobacteriota bacterium]